MVKQLAITLLLTPLSTQVFPAATASKPGVIDVEYCRPPDAGQAEVEQFYKETLRMEADHGFNQDSATTLKNALLLGVPIPSNYMIKLVTHGVIQRFEELEEVAFHSHAVQLDPYALDHALSYAKTRLVVSLLNAGTTVQPSYDVKFDNSHIDQTTCIKLLMEAGARVVGIPAELAILGHKRQLERQEKIALQLATIKHVLDPHLGAATVLAPIINDYASVPFLLEDPTPIAAKLDPKPVAAKTAKKASICVIS